MRQPIFERKTARTRQPGIGPRSAAVSLRIYPPDELTGAGMAFDAYVGSPHGYAICKTMQDLADLQQFVGEAIETLSTLKAIREGK